MKLRAMLFGAGTLVDRQKVERAAYNHVFAEAALPWVLDEGWYHRLRQSSAGNEDLLETLVRYAGWRNTDDLQHLLRVMRRRYQTVSQELTDDPDFIDARMLAMGQAAARAGLLLASLGVPLPSDLIPAVHHAETHAHALSVLNLQAGAVLAIEQTSHGKGEANEVKITAVDKSALLKELAATVPPADQTTIAILNCLHARRVFIDQSFRRSLVALSA